MWIVIIGNPKGDSPELQHFNLLALAIATALRILAMAVRFFERRMHDF
jgi:hypothetical protein